MVQLVGQRGDLPQTAEPLLSLVCSEQICKQACTLTVSKVDEMDRRLHEGFLWLACRSLKSSFGLKPGNVEMLFASRAVRFNT